MSENGGEKICGIIMPISAIDGCSESHWTEVQDILMESIEVAGFQGNLVSNADDVGIIHKRIIQNLYDNPIVVCDVSGKNPNVMFELGMRLAFDKPTIIVKDDKTSYSFDTSGIEHLEYPRDLRFTKIVEFKEKLSEKIRATYDRSVKDQSYTTFLKHFGEFKVAKLEKKEVSGQEFILEELKGIKAHMRRLDMMNMSRDRFFGRHERDRLLDCELDVCMRGKSEDDVHTKFKLVRSHPSIEKAFMDEVSQGHYHIRGILVEGADLATLENELGAKPKRSKLRISTDAESH